MSWEWRQLLWGASEGRQFSKIFWKCEILCVYTQRASTRNNKGCKHSNYSVWNYLSIYIIAIRKNRCKSGFCKWRDSEKLKMKQTRNITSWPLLKGVTIKDLTVMHLCSRGSSHIIYFITLQMGQRREYLFFSNREHPLLTSRVWQQHDSSQRES